MDPLIGFALAHAEQAPLDHLNGVGLQVGEQEEQPIFRRWQRAGPVHGEPAGGSGFPIEAPRRHMGLERGLEGRDQLLKLLQGQAGEIEELRRGRLHVSEPDIQSWIVPPVREARFVLTILLNRDKLKKCRRCITPSLPKRVRRKKDSTLDMTRLSRKRERP